MTTISLKRGNALRKAFCPPQLHWTILKETLCGGTGSLLEELRAMECRCFSAVLVWAGGVVPHKVHLWGEKQRLCRQRAGSAGRSGPTALRRGPLSSLPPSGIVWEGASTLRPSCSSMTEQQSALGPVTLCT